MGCSGSSESSSHDLAEGLPKNTPQTRLIKVAEAKVHDPFERRSKKNSRKTKHEGDLGYFELLDEYKKVFDAYDLTGDGHITLGEVKKLMEDQKINTKRNVKHAIKWFKKADVDHDRQVSWNEFKAKIMEDNTQEKIVVDKIEKQEDHNHLHKNSGIGDALVNHGQFDSKAYEAMITTYRDAFDVADVDKSGELTIKECRKLFKKLKKDKKFTVKFFRGADENHTRTLTWKEFKDRLMDMGDIELLGTMQKKLEHDK